MIDFYRTQGGLTSDSKLKAGVFGASGTTGVEMVRLLSNHPVFEVTFATSREFEGQSLKAVDPAAPNVPLVSPEAVLLDGVDVVFACLPHGHSAQCVEMCHDAGPVVIDLSGDLRLRDAELHQKTYGSNRNQDILEHCVYGLTETAREELSQAKIVSNPGCYPTCVGLALYPLANANLLNGPVIINAVSGVSGAGRKANATTHFCSAFGDVRPYNIGRSHRHLVEMEQSLSNWLGDKSSHITLIFNPHLVPIERGMLATIVVEISDISFDGLLDIFHGQYSDEPFVEVLPTGEHARIRGAVNTNKAVIGLADTADSSHFVITCAIDNLLKGAAGQALQNANLVFGLPETVGLLDGETNARPIAAGSMQS